MRSQFTYRRPTTLHEALDILDSYGDKCRVIAGGTDLMIAIRDGLLKEEVVVDISRIPDLKFIEIKGSRLSIGPLSTHAELAASAIIVNKAGVLASAAGSVGSPQIRNMGTIGGNVVNASPAADTIPALVVLDARVTLTAKGTERTLPVTDLFAGPYETIIDPREVLTAISFDVLDDTWTFSFLKLARRKTWAISRINVAILARRQGETVEEARISVGSSTPTPCRMTKAEAVLRGHTASDALIQEAGRLTAEEMVKTSGVRPSTVYKRPAVQGLVKKALRQALGTEQRVQS